MARSTKRTAKRKPRKSVKDTSSGLQEQGRRRRQEATNNQRKGRKAATLAERRINGTASELTKFDSLSLDSGLHYAFAKWSEFQGVDVNAIGGQFQGNWQFDLVQILPLIREKAPGMDIYLVGYRNEERAPLGSEKRVRTLIPFFAVHCLPRGSSPPGRLCCKKLDKHDATEENHSLSNLAFTWEEFVPQFLTGEKVFILKSTGRKTDRSSQTQSDIYSCGYFWFPGEKFKYSKPNPFGAMSMGDDLEFMDDTWDVVKAAAKQELDEGATLKDILNHGSLEDWKRLFLPKAVTEFMEYYEDEIQGIPEADVESALLKAMTLYRRDRQTSYQFHTKLAQRFEDVEHFKIYADNDILSEYRSKGSLEHISPYAVASEVFPRVEPNNSGN